MPCRRSTWRGSPTASSGAPPGLPAPLLRRLVRLRRQLRLDGTPPLVSRNAVCLSLLTLPLFRAAEHGNTQRLVSRLVVPVHTAVGDPSSSPSRSSSMELPRQRLSRRSLGVRDIGGWSPLTLSRLLYHRVYRRVGRSGSGQQFERRRGSLADHGHGGPPRSASVLIETGILDRPAASGGASRRGGAAAPSTPGSGSRQSWVSGGGTCSSTDRALVRANEAVLPFYVLHQPVIVIVAFFFVGWAAPVPVKYLTLVAVSFAVIVALYEGIVRRTGVLRFLFGMKRS